MRRAGFLGTLLALAGVPVASRAAAGENGAADLIVTGAKVRTVDAAMPAAQAFFHRSDHHGRRHRESEHAQQRTNAQQRRAGGAGESDM